MRALTSIFAIVLCGGPALAADPLPGERPQALDLAPGPALDRDPVLDQLFEPEGRSALSSQGGLVAGVVDGVLAKLGIDRDELVDALSEVELTGAGDNWREESSGEVGLSFGVTEHFSVGPSFGLRYEEENLAGPDEPWSQQLKLGVRYNF